VEVVTGHLFAAFPNFFKELFEQIGVGYKTKFPYIQLHPATVKTENFVNKFIANEANIIISYREMSKDEISTFEKKYDYKPLGIRIALKVYAFYVHKDNPLKGMDGTVQAAFSAPGACPKMTGNFQTWGHFSSTLADILKMESWKNIPIIPYSIKKDSLSYQMVKESLACNGQFSPAMKFVTEQQFAEFISNDKNSIGFAELQQLDPALSVRALPFYNPKQAGLFSSGMIEPSVANARSDEYSLAQNIWIYVNKPPKSTLPPVEHEFIKFIFSPEGNDILEKQKFVPLSQGKRAEELEKLKSE
jgi:phosphate transport system substrate-binding protein